MHKQKYVLLALLFLFCSFSQLKAQIVVTPSTGCLPIGISNALFTYTGPGNPTNVIWNFGDGSPTVTLSAAQHSYPNVGTYTVTFSASIGGSPVTYTYLLIVNPPPTGSFNFSPPSSHCAPMSVNFTGSSTQGNLVYNWVFGDLGGGSGSNITHVYNAQGSFTPGVSIQNTLTGCFLNLTGQVIHVSSLPNVVINATPGTSTCAPSFTTSFNAGNSSSGSPISGGTLTYNWNFGQFGTSTQANTGNIVFSPVGVYPVTLTVTDNNNCSNTVTQFISLLSPTLSVTVPSSVCIQNQMPGTTITPFPLFNTTVSSSEPYTQWNMGDSTVYTFPFQGQLTPNVPLSAGIHGYLTPGLKTLTITATAGQCVTTVTKTIFVEKITANFTGTAPSNTCSPTFLIGYLNQTTVNSSSSIVYSWTVSPWGNTLLTYSTSTAASPVFNLTQSSNNPFINYSHPPYFVKTTMLALSQPLGCRAKIEKLTDTIQRPTAIFEVDKSEGCVPLNVVFTNTSATNATLFPITSYTWNFGVSPSSTLAGISTNVSAPIPTVSFNYTAAGVYYATLSISTASGCGHTSYNHTITVVTPPAINYSASTTSVCAGQTVQLNFAAAPTETVQHWHLESDAGYFSGCVSNANPIWKFNHVGVHDFTISAYQHSCKSSSVFPAAITVKGPVGKLKFETNCTINRKSVKFYYRIEDAQNATLNYGDGSPAQSISALVNQTVTGSYTHTYSLSGDYTVILTSTNSANGCIHSYSTVVNVRQLVADFVFTSSVICKGSPLSMNATASQDELVTCSRGYSWYIDDEAPRDTNIVSYAVHGFDVVGIHTASLVVKDINGCTESVVKNFRVSSPAPQFTFNANPFCLSNMPMQLINQTAQAPDSVKHYAWDMGDASAWGPAINTTLTGFTYSYSPTFSYGHIEGLQTHTFAIRLYAYNTLGCEASIDHTLTVNDPKINVTVDKYSGCAPNAVNTFSFYAANTHSLYNVSYGDGSPINITSYTNTATYVATHVYSSAGSYTPVFTVTDFGGCTKTMTLQPAIEIQTKPVVTFTYVDQSTGLAGMKEYCRIFTASVTSTSQSPYSLGYYWNVGGLAGYVPYNYANNILDVPGTYSIILTASTIPAGCSDTYMEIVKVYDPTIDFKIVPDSNKTTYCLGEPITVSVTTRENVPGFQWDFGDGVPTNTILSTFYHKAVYSNTFFPNNGTMGAPGELTITLTGYSGAQFIDCKSRTKKVFYIKRVLPDFNRNNELLAIDSIHCFGKIEIFKNISATNTGGNIKSDWSFGNGETSSTTDVNYTYPLPGTYTVTLNTQEQLYNCSASVSKKMIIYPLPTANFLVDSFACPGHSFEIKGSGTPGVSGVLTGTILPAPGEITFSPQNSFSLTNTASVSTTYSLKVRDDNGCESSAPTTSIFIQQPAPTIHWDTTVIIGSPIPLNAYAGSGFTYTWAIGSSPYLNCDTCYFYNPVSTTTVNYTYSVSVEDAFKCSVVPNTYQVNINIIASIDVPSAFTPNGDGINDVIYPAGWGIRKLNYFKIFNRWGQLIFESNELAIGWDGMFQGIPQNLETYVYQASVETYDKQNPTLTKTGTFKLLR
jgi:gliding motility-associated-like protein